MLRFFPLCILRFYFTFSQSAGLIRKPDLIASFAKIQRNKIAAIFRL